MINQSIYKGITINKLSQIFEAAKVIAIVGISSKPERPSYRVAEYLQSIGGYRIIPVNPSIKEIFEEQSYGSLTDIPKNIHVDIVNVFRKSKEVPNIAEQMVFRGGIKPLDTLWLQEGVFSDEAANIASKGGVKNIFQNFCIRLAHEQMKSNQNKGKA